MNYLEIQNRFHVDSLSARFLESRSLSEKQLNQLFLERPVLHKSNCEGMIKICQKLKEIKESKRKVLIAGDYDADGICATTILKEALDIYGIESGFYIPNRIKEGYGLSLQTVTLAMKKGYTCIMTVDNGVAAKEALQLAHLLKMDVIVTDHHVIPEGFSEELFLHPTVMEPQFDSLCGAGVAFEISYVLNGLNPKHLMLAAIATVSDVMNLWNENRNILILGLEQLNKRNFTALELLLERKVDKWDEKVIAYQIAPKLNAVGRMSDVANANNVVRYLLLPEGKNQVETAQQIKNVNNLRKEISEQCSSIAMNQIKDTNFNVGYDPSFHQGIVGIIAGKIAEKTKRPAAVFALGDGTLKGSVRSVKGCDLQQFFSDFDDLLVNFGGHELAAGIEIEEKNLAEFTHRCVLKSASLEFTEEKKVPLEVSLIELTVPAIRTLEQLGPFGQGFEPPFFAVTTQFLREDHLKGATVKWLLPNSVDALCFSYGHENPLSRNKYYTFYATAGINTFNNSSKVNLFVEEVVEK